LTKTLDTLVEDIYEVIQGKGGWDATVTEFFSTTLASVAEARFSQEQQPRDYLSLSAIGTPCDRKLWYRINQIEDSQPLTPEAIGTFFYGDLIEALVLSLAKAAGHTVEGMQDRVNVFGVSGQRDAIIDGVTVDAKSASSYGFQKFKNHELREDDPFGYISQLSSYVYAGKDDPLVKNKTEGAFLVVQKDRFKLCLDSYDFTEELENKEKEIERVKQMVAGAIPEDRIEPVQQSKTSPNTQLSTTCGYCEFRKVCWPEARTFLYSTGPAYLVSVVNEPRVTELIE
jgi:CRISPR/Cas system-associated exonuclease Cas4 (RecB family)